MSFINTPKFLIWLRRLLFGAHAQPAYSFKPIKKILSRYKSSTPNELIDELNALFCCDARDGNGADYSRQNLGITVVREIIDDCGNQCIDLFGMYLVHMFYNNLLTKCPGKKIFFHKKPRLEYKYFGTDLKIICRAMYSVF